MGCRPMKRDSTSCSSRVFSSVISKSLETLARRKREVACARRAAAMLREGHDDKMSLLPPWLGTESSTQASSLPVRTNKKLKEQQQEMLEGGRGSNKRAEEEMRGGEDCKELTVTSTRCWTPTLQLANGLRKFSASST